MAALKLHYFDGPGRAETTRLVLDYGKVAYEDYRFGREAWMELKPETPFGQVPFLTIDGQPLAQSAAIDRYAASQAGLLPSDPLKVALAEQFYFLMNDVMSLFISTFTADDKVAARKPIVEGPFKTKLSKLEKHLEGKTYILGDELCYVDFAVFNSLSQWKSGWMEGIPTDFLDQFPNMKAYRNRVASIDFVKAKYADKTAPPYAAFQPDA